MVLTQPFSFIAELIRVKADISSINSMRPGFLGIHRADLAGRGGPFARLRFDARSGKFVVRHKTKKPCITADMPGFINFFLFWVF